MDIAEDFPGIELNNQSLEIAELFYLCDTIGGTVGAFDSAITRFMNQWREFRDLVPLLSSKKLHLEAKSRLNQACASSIMHYGNKDLPS